MDNMKFIFLIFSSSKFKSSHIFIILNPGKGNYRSTKALDHWEEVTIKDFFKLILIKLFFILLIIL